MNEISIFVLFRKISIKRWLKNPVVRKWLLRIALVLVVLTICYAILDGKTFTVQRNIPDAEIYDRKVGPVTFHVIPYDIKEYSQESYDLPVSDIYSGLPLQFTLHFPGAIGVPVVKIQIEGHTCFLGIDTTQAENCILAEGNLHSRTIRMKSRHQLHVDSLIDSKTDFLYPGTADEYKLIFSDDISQPPVLSGLLGLSWLRSFDNVVIDYADRQILFNQPPVASSAVAMKISEIWEYVFVDFFADGRNETGIIDTASNTFVKRRKLEKETKIPRNFFLWREGMPDLDGFNNAVFPVHGVTFGKVNLGTIAAHDNLYWKYQGENRIKRMADYYSFLGYPLWKDHVIQLDFKNQVFRIK